VLSITINKAETDAKKPNNSSGTRAGSIAGVAPKPNTDVLSENDENLPYGEAANLIYNADGSVTVTADFLSSANKPYLLSIPYEGAGITYAGARKTDEGDAVIPFSLAIPGAVIMLITEPGTYGVINNAKTFTDIAGHWAFNNIMFVAARGLYGGIGNNLFSPDTSMTRAMFAQVLANIEGADLSKYTNSRFTDVSAGAWYAPAVEWAADMGIVSGYGGGRFGPEDEITREQTAVMLANYIKYKGYILPAGQTAAFNDEDSVSAWAFEAVKIIQVAGIITGKPGNAFDPKGTATRAEVAAIFARLIEVYLSLYSFK
jgi:hypothetical protein